MKKIYIVVLFFTIIALLMPCLSIFGFDWNLLYYRHRYYEVANIIVILSILSVPFLFILFVKLYKKYEININEKLLFAISIVPFLWGIKRWMERDGLYIWRWILNPYKNALSYHTGNMYAISILGNLEFAKCAVITGILLFVILNSRKENEIKYADFFSLNFVLVGIYQTIRNLECFLILTLHVNLYFDALPLDHSEMILKIVVLPAPLYLGIICAIITMINYFLRKYLQSSV